MTANVQNSQTQNTAPTEAKQSDKEINFRKQEMMYQKQIAERENQIKQMQEQLSQRQVVTQDEDEDDEPYVTPKKLKKQIDNSKEQLKKQTQNDIQSAVQQAIHEDRKQRWLDENADFYDVLQHAQKFAEKHPRLADNILRMPETFERQQLVYNTIKEMGLHKDAPKESSVQEKIDANRRSPYYQPSGVASPAYNNSGDFSSNGQKNAYAKMQELKNRLRL
jgi:hypothetical protein